MAEAYEALGAPAGDTEYLLGSNTGQPATAAAIPCAPSGPPDHSSTDRYRGFKHLAKGRAAGHL